MCLYVLLHNAINEESDLKVVCTFGEVVKMSKNRSQDCALRYSTNNPFWCLIMLYLGYVLSFVGNKCVYTVTEKPQWIRFNKKHTRYVLERAFGLSMASIKIRWKPKVWYSGNLISKFKVHILLTIWSHDNLLHCSWNSYSPEDTVDGNKSHWPVCRRSYSVNTSIVLNPWLYASLYSVWSVWRCQRFH